MTCNNVSFFFFSRPHGVRIDFSEIDVFIGTWNEWWERWKEIKLEIEKSFSISWFFLLLSDISFEHVKRAEFIGSHDTFVPLQTMFVLICYYKTLDVYVQRIPDTVTKYSTSTALSKQFDPLFEVFIKYRKTSCVTILLCYSRKIHFYFLSNFLRFSFWS